MNQTRKNKSFANLIYNINELRKKPWNKQEWMFIRVNINSLKMKVPGYVNWHSVKHISGGDKQELCDWVWGVLYTISSPCNVYNDPISWNLLRLFYGMVPNQYL